MNSLHKAFYEKHTLSSVYNSHLQYSLQQEMLDLHCRF